MSGKVSKSKRKSGREGGCGVGRGRGSGVDGGLAQVIIRATATLQYRFQ